ncbi:MAG: tRNA (adenosine(37)-N6)-threonylcarbamoyltransferase complex dimerization subunit type 1 TsaB [Tenericutes bacterium]|nr:tRNA (adenosine(37)-N6)-threonylcarbamoyltransferase complex dimerization subunit type 1 TsaB [Mycoplasmatota bacterium]
MSKLLKILIIDTATKYIYLSLVCDGLEKQCVYQEGINNHSVTIIPELENILNKENLSLRDLDEIIIGIGPGSYTGVRIGVTVAKMIGYLNHIKVSQISSLALIASASDKEYIIPYIDARRGNAFMALIKQKNGVLEYIKPDCLENMEEFKTAFNHEFDFIGEGVPNINKIINSGLLEIVGNVHELKPNYLRITEAERNKQK